MKETTNITALEESQSLEQANAASRIPEVQEFLDLLKNSIQDIAARPRDANSQDACLRPAYQSLANFLERFDSLTLKVEPLRFTFLNTVVYRGEDSDRNVARRLYSDGIRSLSFHRGITIEELIDFALIMSTNIHSPEYAYNDTISLMWKREFEHLVYIAPDVFAVGDESEEQAHLAVRGIVNYLSTQLTIDESNRIQPALLADDDYEIDPAVLRQATREKIHGSSASPEEKAAILRQLAEEDENRIRPQLISIIFKVLDEEMDADLGEALEEIFIKLLDSFLTYEDFRSINKFLDKFQSLIRKHLPSGNVALVNKIYRLFHLKMGEPERISRIASIMDSSAEIKHPDEIRRYLSSLDEASLASMLDAFEQSDNPLSRPIWCDALIAVGKKHVEFFTRRLSSNKISFVQDMLTIINALDPNCRFNAMAELLDHPSVDIRIDALSTMAVDGNQASRRHVLNALNDADERLRMIAARLLTNYDPSMAADTLLTIVRQSDFSKKSTSEQTALYAALATTNAPQALEYLREQLHASQLLARRKVIETKCLLIDGLAQSGSIVVFKFLKGELEAGLPEAEVRAAAEQACARLREELLGST